MPDTADIRQFLFDFFGDEELTALCFDYFPVVHSDFAPDMAKGRKIQLLLEYCQRREIMPNLLAAIQKARPEQYEKRFPQATKPEARSEPGRPERVSKWLNNIYKALASHKWVQIGTIAVPVVLIAGFLILRQGQDGPTPASTPTATYTLTPIVASVATPTLAPALLLTQTPVPSQTPTVTASPTATATPTSTSTSTVTLTPTQTSSATFIPTVRPTNTPTPLPAPTDKSPKTGGSGGGRIPP